MPNWTRVGAALMAVGVAAAAYGAHGLEQLVTEPKLIEVWHTANRQHIAHALGLLLVGALPSPPRATGWLLLCGILLFSGSLYTMSFTGLRWLGAITPLGGLSFIIGWALLAARGGGQR